MRLHKKTNYMFAANTMSHGGSAWPNVEITAVIPHLIQLRFPPALYIS